MHSERPTDRAPPALGRTDSTPGRIRTCDLRFRKPLLYPLSYRRINAFDSMFFDDYNYRRSPLAVSLAVIHNPLKAQLMAPRTQGGRRKGSRNVGYWFRSGRGWYVSDNGRAVRLCDPTGNHIRDRASTKDAREAYARHLLGRQRQAVLESGGDQTPIMECCRVYLDYVKRYDADSTYQLRANFLFDFCTGFPARFRDKAEQPAPHDRIHQGFGGKPVSTLIPLDVDKWLDSHPRWKGARRSGVQAVKRALNFCKSAA